MTNFILRLYEPNQIVTKICSSHSFWNVTLRSYQPRPAWFQLQLHTLQLVTCILSDWGGFPYNIIWVRKVIFQFKPNLAFQISSTCVKPHWTPLHGRCSSHLASHPQVVSSPSVNLTKKISRPFFVRIWEQGVVDIKDQDASFERAFVFPRFQKFAFNSRASLTSFDSATWVPWGIF